MNPGKHSMVFTWTCFIQFICYSTQQNDQINPIELSALGRVATLTELYDSRNDKFLRVTLLKQSCPEASIVTTQNAETRLKYTMVNTLDEKFSVLDVSADVKMSVMGGLAGSAQGSGKFLKSTKSSRKSAKASFINSYRTRFEQVNILDSSFADLINYDILALNDATHMVTSIQWGANMFMSVEDLNDSDESKDVIEGKLKRALQYLAYELAGGIEVNKTEAAKSEYTKFSLEVYGDLLTDTNPNSVPEAIDMMKRSSTLLQSSNGGKGVALTFTLLPIASIRKMLSFEVDINIVVNDIDKLTVQKTVQLFDNVKASAQLLHDISQEVEQNRQYLSLAKIKQIDDLRSNYENYQVEVQRNLSEHLYKVRSAQEDVTALQTVIIDASNSPVSYQSVQAMDWTAFYLEIAFIRLLKGKNVNLLDRSTPVSHLLIEYPEDDIFILYFHYIPGDVDPTINRFLRMMSKRDQNQDNTKFYAVKYDIFQDSDQSANSTNKITMYRQGQVNIEDYKDDQVIDPSDPRYWNLEQFKEYVSNLDYCVIGGNFNKNRTDSRMILVRGETKNLSNEKNPTLPADCLYFQLPGEPMPYFIWPHSMWTRLTADPTSCDTKWNRSEITVWERFQLAEESEFP